MTKEIIKIENLCKAYGGYRAVDGISFSVKEAECFGLLGPNGAGKTTTMKVIYGKAERTENNGTKVNIFGMDPIEKSLEIKAMSGLVPQENNLDMELNTFDNLYIYSKFYGMSKKTAVKKIEELLEFMEIKEKAKSFVRELSGGMQRRLVIARALLNNPKLLILDEPTTGLDPQVRHMIWNKLRELKESGVTILLTTHYMEEAFQICDNIMIMDKGKKIIEGKPRELLTENLERYVIEIPGICKDNEECSVLFKKTGVRHEIFKDTLFAYGNNSDELTGICEQLNREDYYLRHSNLEDLFLKVTGRSLNELQ